MPQAQSPQAELSQAQLPPAHAVTGPATRTAPDRRRLAGIALMCGAVASFASLDACGKTLAGLGVDPLVSTFMRYAVNVALITLVLRAAKVADGVDGTTPDDYFADEGDPRVTPGTERDADAAPEPVA